MREGTLSQADAGHGEHERLTVQIRDCLRREDIAGAHGCFRRLVGLVTRPVQLRAEAFFDRRRDLVEDAIQETVTLLWARLSDLRDLPGLRHFERRFHQALQSLMQDAFRAVYRRARARYETPDSATATVGDGEGTATALSYAADADATRRLEAVLGAMSAKALLERIPDRRLREAFRLYVEGVPQKEIAALVNCTPRTLYNWMEGIKAWLRAHLESRRGEGA
jgi:RNA polymerase sigma factor (sigma-70 family)